MARSEDRRERVSVGKKKQKQGLKKEDAGGTNDLGDLLEILGSGEDVKQAAAAASLRELVEAEHRILSSEQFSKFMNELYKQIFLLCSGRPPSFKKSNTASSPSSSPSSSSSTAFTSGLVRGGIYAMRELIPVLHEENENKLIRFSNYLRIILQQTEELVDNNTLVLAAEALGELSRYGGNLTADFVEFETKRALEWLLSASQVDESHSHLPNLNALNVFGAKNQAALKRRKFAAVLVIKELASNSPVLFYAHVAVVFDLIRTALHDSNQFTREAATATLRASLALVQHRESRLCVQWYYKVYEIARKGFLQGAAATIHGSLLTLGELLRNTGNFMIPRFSEVCDTILKYRDHKHTLVRRTVIGLLPELASFSPDAFVRGYLDDCISYLFAAVNKPTEQDASFVALGKLAVAVSRHILPHLAEIVVIVREALVSCALNPVATSATAASLVSADAGGASFPILPLSISSSSPSSTALMSSSPGSSVSPSAPSPSQSASSSSTSPSSPNSSSTFAPSHSSSTSGTSGIGSSAETPLLRALFRCVSMLAKAVGPALLEHDMINGLLFEMFSNGLSPSLIDAISDLRKYIPSLDELIVAHVLHALSFTLANRPFRAPAGGGIWHQDFAQLGDFAYMDVIETLETRFPAAAYLKAGGRHPSVLSAVLKRAGSTYYNHLHTAAVPYDVSRSALLGDGTRSPSGAVLNSLSPSILGEDVDLDSIDWRYGTLKQSIYLSSFFPAASDGKPPLDNATLHMKESQDFAAQQAQLLNATSLVIKRAPFRRSVLERELVLLAIQTLREFNFDRVNLLPFLHETVIAYLDDFDPEIRKEVARTCGALLIPASSKSSATPNLNTLSPDRLLANWDETARLASSGVRKLLMAGVSDPEPAMRCVVLDCLRENERFDDYLVQEDTLSALFVALQDESFNVRRIAIAIASRLAPRNPAHINPAIRKCILAAMAQLEFSPNQEHRQEGAVILLGDIVAGFNNFRWSSTTQNRVSPLIAPSIVSLIHILLSKLRKARSTMSTAILRTLGEIASMDGIDMNNYMDTMMPLLIEILQDQGSSEKRRYALRTLGQLVRSTGQVISPLLDYPQLLDTLLEVIRRGSSTFSWELREEALKALGALGALDPFEARQNLTKKLKNTFMTSSTMSIAPTMDDDARSETSSASSKNRAPSGTEVTVDSNNAVRNNNDTTEALSPKDEDYYPTVAINALMKIIQDATLSTHHSMAIQALTHIFRSLGLKCVPFLPLVVPCILTVATVCEQELRKVLIQNISVIVSISKQHVRPYLPDVFHLILRYWYENLDQVFLLIEEISRALREEFVPYVHLVVPNILAVLELMRDEHVDPSSGLLSKTSGASYYYPSITASLQRGHQGNFITSFSVEPNNKSGLGLSHSSSQYGSSYGSHHAGRSRRYSEKRSPAAASGGIRDVNGSGNLVSGSLSGSKLSPSNGPSRHHGASSSMQARDRPKAGSGSTGVDVDLSTVHKINYTKYATPASAKRVFKTIESLGFTLTDYFYLIIPALVDLIEADSASPEVKVYSMHALGRLSAHAYFADYALNAMQCLLRLLRKPGDTNVKCQAVDTLCIFALRFPAVFIMFQQTVDGALKSRSVPSYSIERYKTTINLISNLTEAGPQRQERHLESLLAALYTPSNTKNVSLGLAASTVTFDEKGGGTSSNEFDLGAGQKNLQVNQVKLQRAWEVSERSTSDEWAEWMRRMSVELLRESPSPALRACSAVAQVYNPLANELFNAAFVSCWSALDENFQQSLIQSLETALKSPKTPLEALKTLLDLAEFMEHDDRVLPIGIRDLGDYAQRCHAYAKALHYKEMVFRNLPGACTEGLISINNKLEQPEAAIGILHYVQQLQRRQFQMASSPSPSFSVPEVNLLDFGVAAAALPLQQGPFAQPAPQQSGEMNGRSAPSSPSGGSLAVENSALFNGEDLGEDGTIKLKETWFEKLGRWEEALMSYEEKLQRVDLEVDRPLAGKDLENVMGKVRCLINLGEYDQLMELANSVWNRVNSQRELEQMAPIFSQSAWVCGDWESMEGFARFIPENNMSGYILRTVLSLQRNDFAQARIMIDKGRALLGEQLSALVGESYNRAYRQIVIVQQLAELDEIYGYRQQVVSGRYSRVELDRMKSSLQKMWSKRIRGCQENVAVWQNILGAHSLLLEPKEDLQTYIKFSTICRKSNRLRICLRALQKLGVTDDSFTAFDTIAPDVSFAFLKYRWAAIKAENIQARQDSHLRQSHFYIGGFTPGRRTSFTVVPINHQTGSTPTRLSSLGTDDFPRSFVHPERRAEVIGHLEDVIHSLEFKYQSNQLSSEDRQLLVRCQLKYGSWKFAFEEYKINEQVIEVSLASFQAATNIEPGNYKAWHAWALMNFRAVEFYNRKLLTIAPNTEDDDVHGDPDAAPVRADQEASHPLSNGNHGTMKDKDKKSSSPNRFNNADMYDACDVIVEEESDGLDSEHEHSEHDPEQGHDSDNKNEEVQDEEKKDVQGEDDSMEHKVEQVENEEEEDDDDDYDDDDEDGEGSQEEEGEDDSKQEPVDEPTQGVPAVLEKRFSMHKMKKSQNQFRRRRQERLEKELLERERAQITERMNSYVVPAIHGFFRSIALGQSNDSRNVLQDILRLLTLWFAHGARTEVEQAIQEGFAMVNIGTWLDVIPQLIARIHTQTPEIKGVLHRLLITLGVEHPHALVYPLTVAAKSVNVHRKKAAEHILQELRRTEGNAALVDQAQLVSHELIRVAILWHEEWFETMDDASRMYFTEHNLEGMVELLEPMHEKLAGPCETMHEQEFRRKFGRDLEEAARYVQRYKETGQDADIAQAWEVYYHVFRKIYKSFQNERVLQLDQVSPALLEASNMQLAVPGTYVACRPVVRIESFAPTIRMIVSKQRPRQITIRGSDGKEYLFLLKGHEDLRQDERVMQLFGLVNTLLKKERDTNRYDLSIERYSVIPLSHNVGISQWLANTDTFHALIERFRESRNILMDIEQRLISKLAPSFDTLTVIQKVEAFCHALAYTNGQDLGKCLWLKSRNSEVWLDRRTAYTRSLATMSMVGYILGLGDRHPSNLMLDRASGKVIHIDFGDCFEVAQHRKSFPERVPFRLTRMLIAAMEVSGVEGNFRYTCESVMRVLRANRDSVMAMLGAFVHDPLINWRLLATTDAADAEGSSNPSANAKGNGSLSDAAGFSHNASRSLRKVGSNASPLFVPPFPSGTDARNSDTEKDEMKTPPKLHIEQKMMKRADSSPLHSTVWKEANAQQEDGGGEEEEPRADGEGGRTSSNGGLVPGSLSEAVQAGTRPEAVGGNLRPRARTEGRLVLMHERSSSAISQTPSRARTQRENKRVQMQADANVEVLNQRAVAVLERIHDKLTGMDFAVKREDGVGDTEVQSPALPLASVEGVDVRRQEDATPAPVSVQVQRLIIQATSYENLAVSFVGYCPVW